MGTVKEVLTSMWPIWVVWARVRVFGKGCFNGRQRQQGDLGRKPGEGSGGPVNAGWQQDRQSDAGNQRDLERPRLGRTQGTHRVAPRGDLQRSRLRRGG